MSVPTTLDRLAALPAMETIPREQLEWLEKHGETMRIEDGTRLFRQYDDVPGLLVILSGRFSVRVDQDGVEREVREVPTGGITGMLPYSRISTPRGFLVADGPVDLLAIPPSCIRDMTRECYEFTAICVHAMLDRVRQFKADDKQQEKMASLGRLSAGLAHELNNPTSAIARAAKDLDRGREDLVSASQSLIVSSMSGPALAIFEDLERRAQEPPRGSTSAMDLADDEDRLSDWLDDHGLDVQAAWPLARTGIGEADLARASDALDREQLGIVVPYLAASVSMRQSSSSITAAADRIHALVAAVKKHTHMDRAVLSDSIKLGTHLADTVTLMSSRAAEKSVSVELTVEPDLPSVSGRVAELNQVWMQLVDNALDAVPESGTVRIQAGREGDSVCVRVTDDGPGIAPEDRERVFEPFFTTKDVGQGSGLGLDVVRAVVRSHGGVVTVDSRPGRTEFCVRLPAVGA